MQITTRHYASNWGRPVVLDDRGALVHDSKGIQAIRHQLGLSVADVAKQCGVSPRTVEGWEQGRRRVSTAALYAISELLVKRHMRRSVGLPG